MKVKVLQIHWHEQQPIFSLSLDNHGRLATAGGDHKIRLWDIRHQVMPSHDGMNMTITYRSTLKRHAKAVNIVRFHHSENIIASGGDGGTIIIWKLKDPIQNMNDSIGIENSSCIQEPDSAPFAQITNISQSVATTTFPDDGDGDESEADAEVWLPTAMYRVSENLEDIYDLSWSKSGQFLLIGLTNNTTSIWDIHQGRCIKILKDHHHFVQGVAWDPLDSSIIATQSSDRSVRIYKASVHEKTGKTGSIKTIHTKCTHVLDRFPVLNQGKMLMQRLYHDETLVSFFRRLCFSPDGGLLLTPAGLVCAVNSDKLSDSTTNSFNTTLDDSDHSSRYQQNTAKHCVYLYTRASLNNNGTHAMPIGYFGPFDKPTVAIASHPHLFQKSSENMSNGWLSTPYRMLFAIATLNAIYLYDTIQKSPIALIRDLHYGPLTDIVWSPNGKYLMISSTDGYCSMVSFDDDMELLGQIYTPVSTEQPNTFENISNDQNTHEDMPIETRVAG